MPHTSQTNTQQHIEIPDHKEVIDQCRKTGKPTGCFAWNRHLFVKFGQQVTRAEADIQTYVREHVDSSIVRIPKIHAIYEAYDDYYQATITYLVMERVEGRDVNRELSHHPSHLEDLVKATARAMAHIWEITPPEHAKPGPFHGAECMGGFWGLDGAPAFNSLDELERWINRRLERWRPRITYRLSLEAEVERMHICHCDFNPGNVFVGKHYARGDAITLIDWGAAGVYPKLFDQLSLEVQCRPGDAVFARRLYEYLYGELANQSEGILALNKIAGY